MEYNTPMPESTGRKLKKIRESRDISLDEIALKTHIRRAYLEAIEIDDLESLPSKTHLRGFLRLYASELGVKLDDLQVKGYHLSQDVETTQVPDKPEQTTADESDQLSIDPDSAITKAPEPIPPQEIEETPAINEIPSLSEPLIKEEPDSSKSTEIFQRIGQTLRKRRKSLSLSLDDINEHIHIQSPYLSAIETGRFGELPSPVQARGMLTLYAEFLSLDVNSILLEFSEGLQQQRLERQVDEGKRKKSSVRELSPGALRLKNFFSLDLLIISALFIGFAAFVIWGANRILYTDSPQALETEIPGVSDVLLATGTATPDNGIEADTIDDDFAVTDDQINDPLDEEQPLFTTSDNDNPINLVLIPRQRVWVQVTVDDEIAFEGRMMTGNAYDFSGQDQIDILAGNIGALQIFFNEEDLGSPGLFGHLAELSFTETGLVQPAATSTPTFTSTPDEAETPTETPTPTPIIDGDDD